MLVTAQQVFKELSAGGVKPFYLVIGEEPFQRDEILKRFKAHFIKEAEDSTFNTESFYGESLDVAALMDALQSLPCLFDGPGVRLIVCRNFDKMPSGDLDALESYFSDPPPTACFLMLASKIDKRKSWVKKVDEKGYLLEVKEPYEREWPRWKGYFEKRVSKRLESEAWDELIREAGFSLSLVSSELEKVATFVGNQQVITLSDVTSVSSSVGSDVLFSFADDVVSRRVFPAIQKFHRLIGQGENEIKILSILVRQFRQVEQCSYLMAKGIRGPKAVAVELGIPPFFVPKVMDQARTQTRERWSAVLVQLAQCDYQLKIGSGRLLEDFLVPYFSSDHLVFLPQLA